MELKKNLMLYLMFFQLFWRRMREEVLQLVINGFYTVALLGKDHSIFKEGGMDSF